MALQTLSEILQASTLFLQSKKIASPRRLAEEWLSHVLSIRRIDLYLQFERPLIEEELKQIRFGIKKLSKGEPIEYLIGVVDFYGSKIQVDPRVLIPRPETEILVDHIAKRIDSAVSVWDLCTGSGCIGIALKKKFPTLSVSLSDKSKDALLVAEGNAWLNKVDVEILQGDLLAPFQGRKADVVVINPPYISLNEYFSLDSSVRDFEPKMALVAGEKGTEFYENLAIQLPFFLNRGAQVFFEIGSTQGNAVQNLFSSSIWKRRELWSDWSGKDRFFFLELQ